MVPWVYRKRKKEGLVPRRRKRIRSLRRQHLPLTKKKDCEDNNKRYSNNKKKKRRLQPPPPPLLQLLLEKKKNGNARNEKP